MTEGLSVSELTFQIGGKTVLEQVSFELNPGEIALLCGGSGNGKSSLANVLNGYFPQNGGKSEAARLTLNGKDIQSLPVAERSWQVRTIFQHARLSFSMKTLREEMIFCLENARVKPAEMTARIEEKAARFGLSYLLDRSFDDLSGGELQRAAFVCADLVDAPLYILDEPFANVDDASIPVYVEQMKEWLNQGKMLLVIDHRLDRWEWVDRWLLLDKKGRLHELSELEPENKTRLLKEEGVLIDRPHRADKAPKTSAPVVLELENVGISHREIKRKSFFRKQEQPVPLMEGVTLSLEKGTLAALTGPSGMGKTSLLKTLLNVLPYEGTIRIQGQDIRSLKPQELYRKVGLVFQDPSLQFVQTKVLDEMMVSLKAWNSAEGKEEAAAKDILTAHGFEDLLDRSPWLISQGQQRRLAVLSMTVGDQELLLVDEPTYGQDAQNAENIMQKLAELCRNGITCLFTSHDQNLVEAYADEIYHLEDKRVWRKR